jgi:hypothetical protein
VSPQFYCTACWKRLGLANPSVVASGFCASGQPGCPTKHMIHTPTKPIDSVFVPVDYSRYEEHIRAGAQSGALEIDASGRLGFLTVPPHSPGVVYVSGIPMPQVCQAVKTVRVEGSGTPHAFPVPVAPESERCLGCGKMVPERMNY